jgi:hypothetical protein
LDKKPPISGHMWRLIEGICVQETYPQFCTIKQNIAHFGLTEASQQDRPMAHTRMKVLNHIYLHI